MKISVVTPLYRSEPYIEELCARSVAAIKATGADSWEIILVNDASPDGSLATAQRVAERDLNVTVIDLARNVGQHRASMAGLAHATGDLVFIMDSDLEDKPEWITLFHNEMRARGCDVVFGVMKNAKGGPAYSAARKFFYTLLRLFSNVDVPENVCSARLMTRRYVQALLQFGERELFMAGIWHMAGFTQLPVLVEKGQDSPTTYGLLRLVSIFINAVTAFSIRPLQLIALSGLALSVLALAYTLAIVFRAVTTGIAVEGWASVMSATLLIGGVSMLFNGVMAIYIGKIFIEVKQRPRAIIRAIHRAAPADASEPPAETTAAARSGLGATRSATRP